MRTIEVVKALHQRRITAFLTKPSRALLQIYCTGSVWQVDINALRAENKDYEQVLLNLYQSTQARFIRAQMTSIYWFLYTFQKEKKRLALRRENV